MKALTYLFFTALLSLSISAYRISNDYYTAFIETLGIDAHTTDDGVDCSRVVRLTIEEFRNNLKIDSRDVETIVPSVLSVIETLKFELSPKCRTFYGDFETFMSQYYGSVDALKDTVERNWNTNNAEISATLNHFLEVLKLDDDFEAGQTHANALKLLIGISKPNDSKPEVIFGGANFNSGKSNKFTYQSILNEQKDLELEPDYVYNLLKETVLAKPQNDIDEDTEDDELNFGDEDYDEDFDDEDSDDEDDDDFIQVVFVPYGDDSDTMDDEDFEYPDTQDIFGDDYNDDQLGASFAYDEINEGQQQGDEDVDDEDEEDEDTDDGDDGDNRDEDMDDEDEPDSDEYIQVVYVPYDDVDDQATTDEYSEHSEDPDEEEVLEGCNHEVVDTNEPCKDDLAFENYDSPSSNYVEEKNEVEENNDVNSGTVNLVHTGSSGWEDHDYHHANTAHVHDENDEYTTHFAHGDEYYGTDSHNNYYVNHYKSEYEESDYDSQGISKRLLVQMYFDL